MNQGNYCPTPIDVSLTELPPDLVCLVRALARNAHEIWATPRIVDGWRYGPVRDDARKTHPCLIPYDELPESEKEYDRKAATETLKVILALGYVLTRNPG
jgi:hypothetical protein